MPALSSQRALLAKSAPTAKYNTYWFADVRAERAGVCLCPDWLFRNLIAGNPNHVCVHLRALRPAALRKLRTLVEPVQLPDVVHALRMLDESENPDEVLASRSEWIARPTQTDR